MILIKLLFFIIGIAVILFGSVYGIGRFLHWIEVKHPEVTKSIAGEDDDSDDTIAVG